VNGSGDSKSLSTVDAPGGKKGGTLTVIQKARLSNWAEHHFLHANKIMSFEEAVKDTKMHKAICKAIEIDEKDWAVVGTEAIRKLCSAMSDQVSLHRKVVKGLYMGEYCLVDDMLFLWVVRFFLT
jgi:hypothetical protein